MWCDNFGRFLAKFWQERSHHVMDASCRCPKGSKRCFPNGVFQIPHIGLRQRKNPPERQSMPENTSVFKHFGTFCSCGSWPTSEHTLKNKHHLLLLGMYKSNFKGWRTNCQQNIPHPYSCTGDVHHGFCGGGARIVGLDANHGFPR